MHTAITIQPTISDRGAIPASEPIGAVRGRVATILRLEGFGALIAAILADRALGGGLKYEIAFGATHLGRRVTDRSEQVA